MVYNRRQAKARREKKVNQFPFLCHRFHLRSIRYFKPVGNRIIKRRTIMPSVPIIATLFWIVMQTYHVNSFTNNLVCYHSHIGLLYSKTTLYSQTESTEYSIGINQIRDTEDVDNELRFSGVGRYVVLKISKQFTCIFSLCSHLIRIYLL